MTSYVKYLCCALCSEVYADMQISEAAGGVPEAGAEPCRFPKLEECAHFHYERVQLPPLVVTLQTNMDRSLHSQHTNDNDEEYYMVQVTSGEECWLLQRNIDNFRMLDAQLHQCIYDRKISQLPDLSSQSNHNNDDDVEMALKLYLEKLCCIVNNSLNCGPVLNWLQMDNKGHRLLVPSEESRSINTPAVAAAYSIRRYVSQARDELNLEVGDMISVIDMASPGESIWWRGKRGFQVGFFPQHCVHIIGDKVPRNMPLPPPVVGSLALSPIKPVLRKHGKLIAFFRSFILNRPSRRRLKQSGILKERVFGCDLGEHLLNSGHDIPTVLKCCAEFIEENGIVDGIYRLSGVTSNIQKLRNAFDEDRIPNLYTEEILQDIHSVASLLKMYFRELPNPLCTYQLYQSFVNAVQGCNPSSRNSDTDRERLLKMREAVQKLPPPHYRTLEYLMRHLARVAKHGSRTGMTTRNVAIVWAPNLLRSEELEGGGVAALQGVGVQAVVTEFLICYADLIFCDHLPHLLADGGCADGATVANADRQQSIPSPKRSRPKSLAISTPTKLITLEEARTKHQIVKGEECGYIEVGGGPKNLPKKYHTVLELPSGRKRHSSGWRSFFSKNRNSPQNSLSKNRKASTPGIVTTEKCGGSGGGGGGAETVMAEMRRKLRTVKSAESLTSGISEVPLNNEIIDSLGPLQCLHKPPGHNRSVSHDSYFDTIQNSHNNSEGSLLDLSEIQLNFDLEESEMRIFSEDESLVSSPRIQKDAYHRRYLARTRLDDYTFADSSSPKKQARAVAALIQSPPESTSMSRKRTRLEDQLSDIQYIDCSTPDNPMLLVGTAANTGGGTAAVVTTVSTTAQIHHHHLPTDSYQPKSKSPRNSHESMSPIGDNGSVSVSSSVASNKRQSLNLDTTTGKRDKSEMPKSLTDVNIGRKQIRLAGTPTPPYSPTYRPLNESSAATTPSPSAELYYRTQFDNKQLSHYTSRGGASSTGIFGNIENNDEDYDDDDDDFKIIRRRTTDSIYENLMFSPVKPSTSLPKQQSPTYENVLTTISITYKSPTKRFSNSPLTTASMTTSIAKTDSIHQDVTDSIERAAAVPNEPAAVLPTQEANQPPTDSADRSRPKSLSALEELRSSSSSAAAAHRLRSSNNLSTSAVCNSRSEALTIGSSTIAKGSAETTTTFDSSVSSSELIHDATATPLSASPSDVDDINDVGKGTGTAAYHHFGDENRDDDEDLSLSEILAQSCSSGCGIGDGRTDDYSCPATPTQNSLSPNVSPTQPYSSTTTNKTRNTSDSSLMTTDDPRGGPPGGDRTSTVSTSSTSSSAGNDGRKDGRPAQVRMDKRKSSETTDDDDDDGVAEKDDAYGNNKDDDGDENSIYQQVKYLRRSVHEINSLLQMEATPKQPEAYLLPDFESLDTLGGRHVYENVDCRRQNKHRQQQQQQVDDASTGKETTDTQQHRCVGVAENDDGDEDDNTSANACENVDVKSLTNIFEHIDTRSSHQHTRQSRPLSSSTTTISSSTSPPSPMTNPIATSPSKETNIADGRASKTVVVGAEKIADRTRKNYHEKDVLLLLPPCVRLRNLKHAVKTRSLDECEFTKRCGGGDRIVTDASPPPSSTEWTRRKSFDENLSAGVVGVGATSCRHTTSKSLNPPKQLPPVGDEAAAAANESAALHFGHLHSKHRHEMKAVGGVTKIGGGSGGGGVMADETKLNRERIERYKEERRKELHEKYRSESFKEDKGALLSRLKLKPSRDEIETSAGKKSPAISGDFGSITRTRTRRRSGDSDESNELSCDSLETADMTVTVSAAAAATTTTTTTTVTPALTTRTRDKRDRQRWQPHERRILVFGCVADDEDDDDEKMLTEDNNRSNERKKDNGETNSRIVTTAAGDRNRQRQYKISTETKSPTSKKGTRTSPPSLCIKDMKAIFEPKSQ